MRRVWSENIRRSAAYAVFLAMLVLPFVLWLLSVGNPALLLDKQIPAGQQFYLISKFFALYAVFLVITQVVTMLVLGKGNQRLKTYWPIQRHQILAIITLLVIGAHVGSFLIAVQLRSGHNALFLLLPRFNSGFYDAMVSVGALSAYLIVITAFAGSYARKRAKNWRKLHRYFVYPTVLLVILHSASIGSESRGTAMVMLYVLFLMFLIYILIKRNRDWFRLFPWQSSADKES